MTFRMDETMTFREQLILKVAESSVKRIGVDLATQDIHAKAVIGLVDAILAEDNSKKTKAEPKKEKEDK